MVVSMNVTGKTAAIAFLARGFKDVKTGLNSGFTEVGLHMLNQVKRSIAGREAEHVSVDTGVLLNSPQFTATPLNVSIFTLLDYAEFIENNPDIVGGPRKHFQNSLNRNLDEITRILKKEVKSNVRTL
ncbi:hypothetical protein LCGC14_1997270 [marine sediment metagenome]|uniref:Uncharacterized protein n=1 Tax=marine sediment metagenome TaxID=412755 RepID=A0A0F9F4G4_9ZZZZ